MQWPLLRCNGVFIMYYTLVDFVMYYTLVDAVALVAMQWRVYHVLHTGRLNFVLLKLK